MTNEVTLPEADVMRFVKLDKDYIGKEATQESLEGALPWICVQLEIDADDTDAHASETVYYNGKRVGQVSSGGYGFTLGKSLAFAYVTPEAAQPNGGLEVMIMGEKRPAKVLAEPLYDPDNERPRA